MLRLVEDLPAGCMVASRPPVTGAVSGAAACASRAAATAASQQLLTQGMGVFHQGTLRRGCPVPGSGVLLQQKVSSTVGHLAAGRLCRLTIRGLTAMRASSSISSNSNPGAQQAWG